MRRYRIIYQSSNIEAPQGRFDIGRSLDCHLILDDPSVSRVHATIIHNGDRLLLEDQGSRNGCQVNGRQVSQTTPLMDGDIIKIGHQIIKIKEVQIERATQSAKNTMGLLSCPSCGQWRNADGTDCPRCGPGPDLTIQTELPPSPHDLPIKAPLEKADTQIPQLRSTQMIAGLAQKAIGKEKFSEAKRLLQSLMEANIRALHDSDSQGATDELEQTGALVIELARATTDPQLIGELFTFFTSAGTLMPRATVELLYKTVRGVGYRSGPEMNRYLALLSENSHQFSPGEKFIHRRIEGLVGLCS